MNSAAKIEIVREPSGAETGYEKLRAAIMQLKYNGNGSSGPAASDTGEAS